MFNRADRLLHCKRVVDNLSHLRDVVFRRDRLSFVSVLLCAGWHMYDVLCVRVFLLLVCNYRLAELGAHQDPFLLRTAVVTSLRVIVGLASVQTLVAIK